MAEYVLHCMAQSGHSYKVALMLELCGADWKPEWVDFFNGATRTEEFRDTLNEMGEVPVLVHGDNILTQSAVIMDDLSEKFGAFGWENDEERREIQMARRTLEIRSCHPGQAFCQERVRHRQEADQRGFLAVQLSLLRR